MKARKENIIIFAISFFILGFFTMKSLIDYKNLLHESIHGVIIDERYNKDGSTYSYHTNKNQILNGYYYFRKNDELQPIIGDYILKLPHSLDLFIFTLGEDGDYYIKGEVIGTY